MVEVIEYSNNIQASEKCHFYVHGIQYTSTITNNGTIRYGNLFNNSIQPKMKMNRNYESVSTETRFIKI